MICILPFDFRLVDYFGPSLLPRYMLIISNPYKVESCNDERETAVTVKDDAMDRKSERRNSDDDVLPRSDQRARRRASVSYPG